MKIIHLGLVCVLMGSWSAACAMEVQVEESQEIAAREIAVARAKTLLELGKMLVESKDYEKAREYLIEAATQGTDKASAVAARVQLGELYYGFGLRWIMRKLMNASCRQQIRRRIYELWLWRVSIWEKCIY